MKNFNYTIVFFILVLFASCEKSNIIIENIENEYSQSTFSVEQRESRPTILGEQKANPFSMENMQMALDSIRFYAEELEKDEYADEELKHSFRSAQYVELSTTDLYVRFLPKDSLQYETLMYDSTLMLIDIPLDYEIEQHGDYYKDPKIDGEFTWLYTTVKPGYEPPAGIQYEILSELFIIENSDDYIEEVLSEEEITDSALRSSRKKGIIDRNLYKALYTMSFTLTGNEKELAVNEENNSILKTTYQTCVKKRIFKLRWSSCDTYYKPSGNIKIKTPSGETGLKGVKVRVWRWFTQKEAYTNGSGYYFVDYRFDKLLIGNNMNYKIIYDCKHKDYSNSWTFNKSLFGAACLWRDAYGLGVHSPDGHSSTFTTNSDYWGRGVLNNAIYDYIGYAKADGIALPPSHLDIADKQSNNFMSSAPLLKNHINWSLVYAFPNFWGVVAQTFAYGLLGWAYPDLILKYSNKMDDYEKITTVAWHELTHSSHVRRMISEKGVLWASDYWSANVYQQAINSLNSSSGSPYGNKGDTRWQTIALSEGWANYRAWHLSQKYLGYNSLSNKRDDYTYFDNYSSIARYYGGMFDKLNKIGCSWTNLEKSLCTYSISGFKDNITAQYPAKKEQINNIIKLYE